MSQPVYETQRQGRHVRESEHKFVIIGLTKRGNPGKDMPQIDINLIISGESSALLQYC